MAPLHVASLGHLINMLSLPSSTTSMKGLNNTRAGTDPCRTALGPRSLTDTLNPVISFTYMLWKAAPKASLNSSAQVCLKTGQQLLLSFFPYKPQSLLKLSFLKPTVAILLSSLLPFPQKNPYCIISWSFFTKLPSVTCI